MKKFVGIAALGALSLVVAVALGSASAPRASAAGTGGTISLGTVSGNTVQVNITTPTDPYSGFNLHIHADIGTGVTLNSISGSSAGTVVSLSGDSSDMFCTSGLALPERVFACAGLAGQAITTGGLLATFVFSATGNGCMSVNLVRGADATDSTYTVDSQTSSAQSNVVSSTRANILVGNGTAADCAGIVIATPTATSYIPTWTPTNTPVPTLTPTKTPVPATNTPTNTPGGPTNTAVPTDTPTIVPPTATPTSTPTDVPTATPCAGECPTPTATSTPSGGYPPPTGNCVLTITTTVLVGEQAPITVTVVDATGAPVAGATVEFSILQQPGTDATVTADASVTDALGVVTAAVSVGSTPGIVQVRATAPTVSCSGSVVVS